MGWQLYMPQEMAPLLTQNSHCSPADTISYGALKASAERMGAQGLGDNLGIGGPE